MDEIVQIACFVPPTVHNRTVFTLLLLRTRKTSQHSHLFTRNVADSSFFNPFFNCYKVLKGQKSQKKRERPLPARPETEAQGKNHLNQAKPNSKELKYLKNMWVKNDKGLTFLFRNVNA